MRHADGLGPLCLPRIDTGNGSPNGLRKVGAGVEAQHQDTGCQRRHIQIKYLHTAVKHHDSLDHHRGPPENLHIDVDDDIQKLYNDLPQHAAAGLHGNPLNNSHNKANQASQYRAGYGNHQCDLRSIEEHSAVILPDETDPSQKTGR